MSKTRDAILRIVRRLEEGSYQFRSYNDLDRRDQVMQDVAELAFALDESSLDTFFSRNTHVSNTLEALQLIGAAKAYDYVKEACALFPAGTPIAGYHEQAQFLEGLGKLSIEELLTNPRPDVGELCQVLLYYWRSKGPGVVQIEISGVRTAADLLALTSQSLGLRGSYGNSLAKFADALISNGVMPRKLVLRGWQDVKKRLPRDIEMLEECVRELGAEYPELTCEVEHA